MVGPQGQQGLFCCLNTLRKRISFRGLWNPRSRPLSVGIERTTISCNSQSDLKSKMPRLASWSYAEHDINLSCDWNNSTWFARTSNNCKYFVNFYFGKQFFVIVSLVASVKRWRYSLLNQLVKAHVVFFFAGLIKSEYSYVLKLPVWWYYEVHLLRETQCMTENQM